MAKQVPHDRRTRIRRKPSIERAFVRGIGETPLLARVVDESFGGLGLSFDLDSAPNLLDGFCVGTELAIEMYGTSSVAIVRHAGNREQELRVGVEWKANAITNSLSSLGVVTSEEFQRLATTMLSGLSRMWEMHEAGQWSRLIAYCDRLFDERDSQFRGELRDITQTFQQVVRDAMSVGGGPERVGKKIEPALNELIRSTTNVLMFSAKQQETLVTDQPVLR